MIRFQFPNFESQRMRPSTMEAVCGKGACHDLGGIKLHEVQKHMLELDISPTLLPGSEHTHGSAANMICHRDKSESLATINPLHDERQASATTSSSDCEHSRGLCHLSSSYGQGPDAHPDADRCSRRDAALSNLFYFAGKHQLATKCFFQVRDERCMP